MKVKDVVEALLRLDQELDLVWCSDPIEFRTFSPVKAIESSLFFADSNIYEPKTLSEVDMWTRADLVETSKRKAVIR